MDADVKHKRVTDPDRHRYRSLGEFRALQAEPWLGCPPGSSHDSVVAAPGISRRGFLNLLSASAALALGTSCSRVDRGTIVPYTRESEGTRAGVATYYATTFQEGLCTHGVLVKTREGRPIHVEGNAEHAVSRGKASLRAVADLLALYDPDRLRAPVDGGASATWEQAEQALVRALRDARQSGQSVLLLTEAVVSPTRRALIEDLKRTLPSLRHAAWEPAVSQSEWLAARALYGEWVQPSVRLDRADVILSLQADFLGGDGHASALIQDFAARRRLSRPADPMNRLWALESCLTLTGANADQRVQIRPTRMAPLMFALARALHLVHGVSLPAALNVEDLPASSLAVAARDGGVELETMEALARDLARSGRSAVVLAGSALPPEAHVACQLLNSMLGAEGHTVDASLAAPAPELLTVAGLADLLREAAQGRFAAALFWGTNPAFSFPQESLWKSAAAGIPARFRIGLCEDETALECQWRLPEHHWLEAWGDFEPSADLLSLRQPVTGPIHATRQGEDILLACLRGLGGDVPSTYLEYLKARWQREVYPAGAPVSFDAFWSACLHDGVLKRPVAPRPPRTPRVDAIREAVRATAVAPGAAEEGTFELVLSPDSAVYDGRYANNGWLHELPDPVTKAVWGNPLLISIADAARLGIADEDLVEVTAGTGRLEVPAILQPGQAPGTVTLAFGQGRRTGNVARAVGVNAYPLMDATSSAPQLRRAVTIRRTGKRRAVPRTQEHHRMEGRDLARSWTAAEYARRSVDKQDDRHETSLASLVPSRTVTGHKWGMVIDLSACVGCSACLIACQSENNIPVVGPEQVRLGREMHWIRIDRYYEGDPHAPTTVHQPVPCQHCDDAPCEIVCPVNATTHSPDGINQMAYNRCVGTRYCSNNCPFKVRRFNFFDYTSMRKAPENLAFNPEVTVRPRGVMEKCSFCIQRIEDTRLRARTEDRPVRDGEVRPACAVACPAGAIVFGDLGDSESLVSSLSRSGRGYRMLDELGVKAAVTYLADISNPVTGQGKT